LDNSPIVAKFLFEILEDFVVIELFFEALTYLKTFSSLKRGLGIEEGAPCRYCLQLSIS